MPVSASASLVQRAQRGERAALAELVETHQSRVYTLSLALMRNPSDAADMTQEVFVRVLRTLGAYRGDTAAFGTWLHRLTVNICLDGLRRRARQPLSLDLHTDTGADAAFDIVSPDPWDQPAERLDLREAAREVRTLLQELPLPQRLALTLHYFEDSSYDEIASVMGIPLNTVKSHILRGKERMARRLARPAAARPRAGGLRLLAA